jgi:hypothetical protein
MMNMSSREMNLLDHLGGVVATILLSVLFLELKFVVGGCEGRGREFYSRLWRSSAWRLLLTKSQRRSYSGAIAS